MENIENSKARSTDFSMLSDMPEFKSESESEPKSKQDSIDTLIELGYGADDAKEISQSYGISGLKDTTLSDNIKRNSAFLQELGYSQDDVIMIQDS